GDLADSKLGRAFGVHPAKEVPDAVRLVDGHQRGALPGEAVPDLLQLGQLLRWRKPCVVVRQRVRPQHTTSDRRQDYGSLDPATALEKPSAADHAGKEEGRRGRRKRL